VGNAATLDLDDPPIGRIEVGGWVIAILAKAKVSEFFRLYLTIQGFLLIFLCALSNAKDCLAGLPRSILNCLNPPSATQADKPLSS
jgi:hypothetical protein